MGLYEKVISILSHSRVQQSARLENEDSVLELIYLAANFAAASR